MSRGWKSGGDFPVRYGWKQNSYGKWYYSRKQQSSRFPWSAARAFVPDLDYELPIFRSYRNWKAGYGWQPGYNRYEHDTAANRRYDQYIKRKKIAWARKTFHKTPYRTVKPDSEREFLGWDTWNLPFRGIWKQEPDRSGHFNPRGVPRWLAKKPLKYAK